MVSLKLSLPINDCEYVLLTRWYIGLWLFNIEHLRNMLVLLNRYTLLTERPWHEDVTKWLLTFCVGNSSVTGEFSAQRPLARSFDVLNGWVNSHEAGDFRRHRAHYDAIVTEIHVQYHPEYGFLSWNFFILATWCSRINFNRWQSSFQKEFVLPLRKRLASPSYHILLRMMRHNFSFDFVFISYKHDKVIHLVSCPHWFAPVDIVYDVSHGIIWNHLTYGPRWNTR